MRSADFTDALFYCRHMAARDLPQHGGRQQRFRHLFDHRRVIKPACRIPAIVGKRIRTETVTLKFIKRNKVRRIFSAVNAQFMNKSGDRLPFSYRISGIAQHPVRRSCRPDIRLPAKSHIRGKLTNKIVHRLNIAVEIVAKRRQRRRDKASHRR